MRHGRLADLLAILCKEPLNARLVRWSYGLAAGPSSQRSSLIQRQGMALFGSGGCGGNVMSRVNDQGRVCCVVGHGGLSRLPPRHAIVVTVSFRVFD